ncbi:MAG: sulfotransferase [Nitrospinota bacterium]|nr:sulfotransferase [Nitrospinota bacterium]
MSGFTTKLKKYLIYRIKIARAYLKGEIPDRGPDFFIVGATRSGTTFLHHMLGSHPDIFMPETKELMYFNHDRRFRPDLKNYMKMFHGYRQEKLIGEATPLYMETGTLYDRQDKMQLFQSESAIQRIYESLPNAKIIVSLRSPITRIVSVHRKNRLQGKTSTSLREEIENGLKEGPRSKLFYKNRYDIHLENIFKYFPRSHVKIIIFEEWTKNVQAGMADICAFLGISDMKSWPKLPEKAQNKANRYSRGERSDKEEIDVKIDPELRALVYKELFMVYEYVEKLMGRKIPWQT